MDDFFQKNLREVVDTTTRPWTFRRGIDGGAVGTSGSILAFQRAAVIRDAFFPAGGVSPQFRVDIKPVEMDPTITGYTLDVDGTVVTHTQGPASPRSVVWPGPAGRSQVRLQLSPTVSASSTATFEGPWALHRLFDRAQVAPTGSPERFTATLNLDGRRVVLDVTAGSIRNPFRLRELEEFKCPG
jgi:type VI secretion system protein ImpL